MLKWCVRVVCGEVVDGRARFDQCIDALGVIAIQCRYQLHEQVDRERAAKGVSSTHRLQLTIWFANERGCADLRVAFCHSNREVGRKIGQIELESGLCSVN